MDTVGISLKIRLKFTNYRSSGEEPRLTTTGRSCLITNLVRRATKPAIVAPFAGIVELEDVDNGFNLQLVSLG